MNSERLRLGLASLGAILLAACGGGGGGGDSGTPGGGGGGSGGGGGGGSGGGGSGGGGATSYTVGGTVSGLSGAGLILQVNGGSDLSLTSSGNFSFAAPVAIGATYNVSIRTQPSNPTQTCALANASGTIASADVTNVTVTCTTNAYTLGGLVSGLSVDSGLVLQSGTEELTVSRNGSFTFATAVLSGVVYNVTVKTQPTAPVQTCTVANASGTMGSTNVASLDVSCDGIALLAGALGGPGSIDGVGTAARFKRPGDVAVDAAGNVYISDSENRTIRKITAAGVVSTVAGRVGQFGTADGNGSAAQFFTPAGMTTDIAGNVYLVDSSAHTVRRMTPAGDVTTLAGGPGQGGSADGPGSVARFSSPRDVAADASGNLYVADGGNHTIRRITAAGVVSTFAGTAGQAGNANGVGSAARFNSPRGIVIDTAGNLYVTDTNGNTIRKITPAAVVTTFAGTPGQFGFADGTPALFTRPERLSIDASGNLLVADTGNQLIRQITPAGVTSTVAGTRLRGTADGAGNVAQFNNPTGIAIDAAGNAFVADNSNNTIRKITAAGVVSTIAGAPAQSASVDGVGAEARFFDPYGVAADAAGNVYVADGGHHTIRKITPSGVVSTFAGLATRGGVADGDAATARFNVPTAIAIDSGGNLYVTDFNNNTIRKITPAGVVSTLAGMALQRGFADGVGSAARFDGPYGIAVDAAGMVYVAEQSGVIRKITPDGTVTTLAGVSGQSGSDEGTGSAARFQNPQGIDVDSAGNVYVADTYNYLIRKITPAGVVSTLAGSAGAFAFADGVGSAARFNAPFDVAVDSTGNVYVADQSNYAVRRITPDGTVTTVAGTPGAFGVRIGPLPGSLGEMRSIALLPGRQPRLVEVDSEKGVLMITLP